MEAREREGYESMKLLYLELYITQISKQVYYKRNNLLQDSLKKYSLQCKFPIPKSNL